MAGATEKKNAALAWAEKRKAQVETAKLKKAQKEMGEVTSDHTFKPKLRSGKASRSLVSVGSGKITPLEKPNLVSPVLKRRAGDVNLDASTVEATAPVKVQERSTPQVRARKDLPSAGGKAPRELGEPREAAPKRPGGRAASPGSPGPSPALSPRTGAPRAAGTTVAAPARPDRPRPAEAPVEKTPVEKVPKAAAAPPASEGLCWKAMTNGLRHWREAAPAAAVCFPDAPVVFSSNDLPVDEEPQVTTLPVDPSGQKSVGSGKISSEHFRSTEEDGLEAHLKLERLRQQLEEEQRQLEEEAAQLRQGGQVDAQRLQQLAEKQQQRLARFDKEHEQMEQSESAWVEDLASMPLPVITEQPELLEEFQSQHLEAFERLQKQWQLEQVALQEQLQEQMQHTPLQASEPQNDGPPAQDEAERKAAAVSKLAESLQVLQRQRQETELNERQEQQELSERIKKFNMKVESLEARVKEPTSPSLFGVFQEFWTSEAFAGGADGDWFKSAATRLADLMAPPEAQDAPDRTERHLGEEDVPSAPQEKATSVTSTRRWPPGPLR